MEQKTTKTYKPFKFINGITTFKPIKREKLHNELVDQYEEIEPYKTNIQTGEIINKTNKYIYKKIEPRNIYKEIQSHAKDADIITKIKNMTPATKEQIKAGGIYLDLTKVGNIHQEHEKTLAIEKQLAQAEIELAKQKEALKNQKIIEAYKAEQTKIEAEKKAKENK